MKPFFTYFGGKYRVAPKYPSPLHETLIEPIAVRLDTRLDTRKEKLSCMI